MKLSIKAQIIGLTQKCSVKCVRLTKCVKVRTLFVKNKMRFARAEQL